MNYAQKYDLFFPYFIKLVVNKSKEYSFLIIGMMHLQKNITFSYDAAIPFFQCWAGHLSTQRRPRSFVKYRPDPTW